jgi:uncharacterized protein YwqG
MSHPIDRVANLAPLKAHADYLHRIARPCVNITLNKTAPTISGSRFGGHPFVPADFQWPQHDIGIYRFLGQIDFAEVAAARAAQHANTAMNTPTDAAHTDAPSADAVGALPASGLLALFYAEDEEGEVFWGDDGYVLGFYWPQTEGHALMHAPAGKAPKAKALTFTHSLDLPQHIELRQDWPFENADDEEAALECLATEAREVLGNGEDYLLGYPSFYSLAYDPTPGEGWTALLTVKSHDHFNWCWHDGDKLMIFIEAEKLQALDFGRLKTDAG